MLACLFLTSSGLLRLACPCTGTRLLVSEFPSKETSSRRSWNTRSRSVTNLIRGYSARDALPWTRAISLVCWGLLIRVRTNGSEISYPVYPWYYFLENYGVKWIDEVTLVYIEIDKVCFGR